MAAIGALLCPSGKYSRIFQACPRVTKRPVIDWRMSSAGRENGTISARPTRAGAKSRPANHHSHSSIDRRKTCMKTKIRYEAGAKFVAELGSAHNVVRD